MLGLRLGFELQTILGIRVRVPIKVRVRVALTYEGLLITTLYPFTHHSSQSQAWMTSSGNYPIVLFLAHYLISCIATMLSPPPPWSIQGHSFFLIALQGELSNNPSKETSYLPYQGELPKTGYQPKHFLIFFKDTL